MDIEANILNKLILSSISLLLFNIKIKTIWSKLHIGYTNLKHTYIAGSVIFYSSFKTGHGTRDYVIINRLCKITEIHTKHTMQNIE